MIKAIQIQKSYGPLQVLKGVDLQVEKGELVSIVGASGAGKSTLLHIIGTLDKPDAGEVIMNDIRLSGLNEKELAHFRNKHIGFVFQFHHLLPEFTALENVCIPGFIAKTKESVVNNRAKELLDFLGLKDRLEHKPGQLSGGEQQRVVIARAIINDPTAIFADEPTGNLDPETSDEIMQLLRFLNKEYNTTILMATHNYNILEKFPMRILRTLNGQLIQEGQAATV